MGTAPSLDTKSLAARAEQARTHLDDCQLCPHRCGAARTTGRGVCRVDTRTFIASEMLHLGEEEAIRPAHAVFFSGCTATCTFCTAARFAFRPQYGVEATPGQLAAAVRRRTAQGARTLEFVGGDPLPHLPFVLATLALLGDEAPPVVWNSNFYHTPEALALLDGVIALYLPDLKFGNDRCGVELGGMPDYWAVVTGAIAWAAARSRVMVRHLLMPGHFDCCTEPALRWLADVVPQVTVSLLTQYFPPAHARGPLAALLSNAEIEQARDLAQRLNLTLAA
ncbi:radical SAM protein [Candidatus Amarolinea aalborgensis]|jgi:putative pyruvate formate lyase activating enzyme|uniref:radical SAM protein n=1 Tax=Candidatus Amarolinea aalborgensis TaxID=2249329 RepID=UPI003BFA0B55